MAIVTGDLYKGFTFGDISSKAYGVYITQEAAYNAPDRDVEVVEIAGRNGAYILDKGRFKNITVSYKCGIALDSEHTFESAIRTFRNALSSKAGKYVRLEDEYNPNEYRQAAFLGGIEVDMADRRAGEFTVSFDAMPQRFLKSGETAVSVASGGTVNNPTLFEAHPLLQVWGYGDIGINDDTINIADDVIGDVTLWERPSTQWDHKGGITYSQSNLRSGDRITVSKGSRALIELDFPQGDIVNNVSHTVTGGDADKFSQIVDIRRESAAYIDVYYNALTFFASSNSSETATIEVTIEHTPSGGSATVSTVNCEFEITNVQISAEQHKYKMWISGKPTGNYSSVISEYKYGYRIERMTAYSTKSALGEPLYFDLDIGEAYKIEDGQTISVNNAVSFPAQLPVLKSGSNTITYENTVDQLKIVPRWWEV